jgi:hypothetical protein
MFDLWKLTVVAMYCAHRFSQYGSTILFTGSRWELKELLAGDNDDPTRCPADLAPGDGLLPAEDNLFPMGRKLLPGGDL